MFRPDFVGGIAAAGVMSLMEPELLGRLLDRHGSPLVLYARQWCAAPEDVVQEAFLKLAALARSPDRVVPWLYRVVRNAAISAGRAERRRRHHESVAASHTPGWFIPGDGTLDATAAESALRALPLEQREIIVAHLWGGLTFEEIAAVAGCSSSTVHRRYTEGLAELRRRLGVSCRDPNTS
jgi:RNA polymerase sigma-70 factor (ECF subfamily)